MATGSLAAVTSGRPGPGSRSGRRGADGHGPRLTAHLGRAGLNLGRPGAGLTAHGSRSGSGGRGSAAGLDFGAAVGGAHGSRLELTRGVVVCIVAASNRAGETGAV